MQQQGEFSNRLIKSRWFLAGSIILIIFLLLLALLPRGIQYGISSWYKQQGIEQVTIENIDFNPFTGTLVIQNMLVEQDQDRLLEIAELSTQIDWIPLFSKHGSLQHIVLNHASIKISEKKKGLLHIAGVIPSAKQEPVTKTTTPWGIGIQSIQINDTEINYSSPDLNSTFGIRQMRLSNLSSWEPEQSAQLELQGTINKASISASGEIYPFREVPGYKGTLTLKQLALKPFSKKAASVLSELSGILNTNLKLELDYDPNSGISYSQQGNMELLKTRFATASHTVNQERLAWEGKLSYRVEEGKPTVIIEGSAGADKLFITDNRSAIDLLGVDSVQLNGIRIQSFSNIQIARLVFDQLRLVQKQLRPEAKKPEIYTMLQSELVSLNKLMISDLHDIDIQSVEMTDLLADLRVNKQGKLLMLDEIFPAVEPSTQEKKDKAATPAIRIANTSILGSSLIKFQDYSVDPQFRKTIHVSRAQLSNLDSTKPEQPGKFLLEGKVGKYSTIAVRGSIQPFTQKISLDLVGKVDALELPPLTSYTSEKLGYNLLSGQMDADIKLKIVRGKIDATNKLAIRNLAVKPVDEEKMKKLTQQISVPLESALTMLRDKENNISLEIPVTGDIEDPEFDISDAINQAMGNAMKLAAVGFMQHALQPYGALITIVKIAGKAASAVHLDPLVFTTGKINPEPDTLQYLGKVASLMQERPKLRIKLCGKATELDRLFLLDKRRREAREKARKAELDDDSDTELKKQPGITDNELLELATKRADSVKDILIKQYQIDVKRLFICHSEIDVEAEAKPRVDLMI